MSTQAIMNSARKAMQRVQRISQVPAFLNSPRPSSIVAGLTTEQRKSKKAVVWADKENSNTFDDDSTKSINPDEEV